MVEMINIGFSSVIPKNRIIGIDETGSSPIKRMIKRAKDENRVIDVSHGRKIKSVIWLDNGTAYPLYPLLLWRTECRKIFFQNPVILHNS